eukprot:GHVO01037333.1.p1 GENE.GHVO01037333.1~~GHVO01037333.1.p1  ORF type:complete len:295 (-),score=37.36 GHVO01037333.1:127-1011(-)
MEEGSAVIEQKPECPNAGDDHEDKATGKDTTLSNPLVPDSILGGAAKHVFPFLLSNDGNGSKRASKKQCDRSLNVFKWKTLQHNGPYFGPPYEPLPDEVKLYYDGKEVALKPEAEEAASFYGRMIDSQVTIDDVFDNNFFTDWKKTMTDDEKKRITDLKKCNFRQINEHYKTKSKNRRSMTRGEKEKEIDEKYGFCVIDGFLGRPQKLENFRIRPPKLFNGNNPQRGKFKQRIFPEDVVINCSKDFIPEPPEGHQWNQVQHDNTISWLCSWKVDARRRYVKLEAASEHPSTNHC